MRTHPPGTTAVIDNGLWRGEMGAALSVLHQPPGSSVIRVTGTHIGLCRMSAVDVMRGEWLCFIDADHEFPPDALMRLLSWDEQVVSALNVDRGFPFPPIAFKNQPRPTRRLRPDEIPVDGLLEVGTIGCGMTLIRRQCLEDTRALLEREAENERAVIREAVELLSMAPPSGPQERSITYLKERLENVQPLPLFAMGQIDPLRCGEDTFFGFAAARAGHTLYVDCGLRPGHALYGVVRSEPNAAFLRMETIGAAPPVELRFKYRNMSEDGEKPPQAEKRPDAERHVISQEP